MLKFKAIFDRIERVQVAGETEKKIRTMNGRLEQKVSSWCSYFDTWEQAHEHLLKVAMQNITHARLKLQSLEGKLGNIKGMKP